MLSDLYVPKRALGLVALVLVTAGCSGTPAALSDVSPSARNITDLFTVIFWLSVGVFVITEGVLLFTILRFRRRQGAEIPTQVHGNNALELAWTIAPALIIAFIFVITVRTMAAVGERPAGSGSGINVTVTGHQWWWEFQYPDLGIVTADELYIPVDRTVNLRLNANDVIHSFWVPQLNGKTDAIPGRTNTTWIQADRAGVYTGHCAEFCGLQHANMMFFVHAVSSADFDTWVKQMKTPPAAPSAGDIARGKAVLEGGACVGCHSIEGTKAQGKVGPNLTHIGSHQTIAAGTLPMSAETLARWIKNPQAVKPGALMPNLGLSDADVNSLVTYLLSLK